MITYIAVHMAAADHVFVGYLFYVVFFHMLSWVGSGITLCHWEKVSISSSLLPA